METKRKLASIQRITGIRPIEGADKIEVVQVLGWECVTRKGEFSPGDLVVYCEVDSMMPEKPEFEFLRDRKFRIKTIKLRKQISQGIIFPLNILPSSCSIIEGNDVTEVLGVKKYDLQLQEEQALKDAGSKSKINKFFMRFGLYRFIYFKLNHKDKGWPDWISHTDEENFQVCMNMLISRPTEEWYVAEKLDGQSGTFFVEKIRKFGRSTLNFGVCSRNIRIGKPDNSNYWKMVEKYDLRNKLLSLEKAGIVVQAEICGGKVQGNRYDLPELDLYVFNVIENDKRYSLEKMIEFCNKYGLKHVPILYDSWVLKNPERPIQEIRKELLEWSNGKSVINKNTPREGFVLRLKTNTKVSFKIRSPEFLLKYDE